MQNAAIIKDRIGLLFVSLFGWLLPLLATNRADMPRTMRALDRRGLLVFKRHYYLPFVTREDLRYPLSDVRALPGIKFDAEPQLQFLAEGSVAEEIRQIADRGRPELPDGFWSDSFGHGDADALYTVIRKCKPKRIIEVGCGQSTRIIQVALAKSRESDPSYACEHICIEPYEQPWLEKLGPQVVRERVERCDPSLFETLGRDDILFIDSSHVIRPQGDVTVEINEILPRLASGVIVHFHDIYTPRDYPEAWILGRGVLWNEQYLLEAFLGMNSDYEILLALNWLANLKRPEVAGFLPGLGIADTQPGSFWMRRV